MKSIFSFNVVFTFCIMILSTATLAKDTLNTETFALEEIVVTAQRREQNLQDVPIAVQAFTADALINAGVNSVNQLGTITPSLNITNQLMGITPYIRGVGSPEGSVGSENAVATYVDGVYMANANSAVFELNNIERIEVIKGPQGTLFGRNTTGGLIHVITKDPASDTSGTVKLSYGSYDTVGANFYGTTGLSDSISADLAVIYKNQDKGYGDNLTLGTDINKGEEISFRSKWLFSLSDNTEFRVTADYADIESSLGIYNAIVPGSLSVDGQLFFAGCIAGIGGNPSAPTPTQFGICQPVASANATRAPDDFQDTFAAIDGITTAKTFGLSAKLDHSFGQLDFVSISAYRDSEATQNFGQTVSPLLLVHLDIDKQTYKTFSQEFQLISQGDSFEWILGAYYYANESGFNGPKGLEVTGLFVPVQQNVISIIDTTSYALFGEATYSLTERTRLTAGLRWTNDERDIEQTVSLGGVPVVSVQQDDSWSEATWRMVVDYDLTDSSMLYGSYSRGFKSGNYNVSGIGTPTFNPEFLDAYEIGLKSKLADGRVQLNMAVYYYEYEDLQVNRAEAGSLITVNAATAEITGFEMDVLANITDRLQLRAGLSMIDHEYTEFPNAPAYIPNALGLGGNDLTSTDAAGNKLLRVPDYTFNIGGTYLIPVNIGNGELLLGANYYYNDGFFWEASNRIEEESYEVLNLSLSWRNSSDTWGLRFYGENVLDAEYSTFTVEQAVGDIYEPAAPVTFGLELSYDF